MVEEAKILNKCLCHYQPSSLSPLRSLLPKPGTQKLPLLTLTSYFSRLPTPLHLRICFYALIMPSRPSNLLQVHQAWKPHSPAYPHLYCLATLSCYVLTSFLGSLIPPPSTLIPWRDHMMLSLLGCQTWWDKARKLGPLPPLQT